MIGKRGCRISGQGDRPAPPPLSPAEHAIVGYVCAGWRNAEIARAMGKSTGTVKNQLATACRKLGVHSRARLILHQQRTFTR
jgi:DNA-binding NarL/FixJ family response regulator